MTLQQFLAILRARMGLVMAVFLVTVSAATITALLIPKVYTATATLIIDAAKPDPLSGAVNNSNNVAQTVLATQIGVIKSERVALDVVRKLRLTDRADLREKWSGTARNVSFEVWLAHGLQKAMEAAPARDSNVINIDVEGTDPNDVATVANAFAQAYLALSVKLRADPARLYSSFFEGQATELRTKVTAAQERLSAFQRDKGVIVTDDRLDGELAHMGELSAKLAQARTDTSELRGSKAQALTGSVVSNSLTAAAMDGLRADITHAEAQLQDFSTRWGDNHPQVVQARAAVASLQARLNTELQNAGSNAIASDNLRRQQVMTVRGALESQRARVVQLKSMREEGLVLLRDVENAQRAYDNVQARLSQSTLESHATLGNAVVLAEATPAQNPSSPRALVNISLAGVVGLVLAMGAAILLEMADPRIRTQEATFALLGQPLLGVLPKPGAKGSFAPRRIPLVGGHPPLARTAVRKGQSWT